MWFKKDDLENLGAEPEMGKRKKITRSEKTFHEPPSKSLVMIEQLKKHQRPLAVSLLVLFLMGPIIVNTLFLQTVKHPSPLFAPQVVSKQVTAAIPRPKEIVLGQNIQKPASNPLVLDIQRHLTARGYYNAEVDGVMGARTRAAIGLYQRAFGEIVTHEASHSLLQHIRLSNPSPAYHAKVRKRVAEAEEIVVVKNTLRSDKELTDRENIKQVQRALTRLGYQLIDDGIAGENTKKAIMDFQEKHGLEPDGNLTLVLLNELKKLQLL